MKRENILQKREQKGVIILKNFATPEKGVCFSLPNVHGKGDTMQKWEQFSHYGSMSDNPSDGN
jgi:hypothetical protein